LQTYHFIKKRIPRVTFIIERSKNKNVVVYEALLKDGKIDNAKPIDVYWQDIDPAYVKANRAKGKLDDRENLNMIENSMAYGCSAKHDDKKPGTYKVNCVAISDKDLTLVGPDDKGEFHVRLAIKGKMCNLVRVFVHSVDRLFGLMPKVEWVEFVGFDIESGELITERVVPK